MNNTLFVSRAGEKLSFALKEFNIDVKDKICADFGSSTGGFVDCLLKNGAKLVYSVDTAYGELAWKLRQDKRVVVLEKTNAMHVDLPEKMDLITCDTSWTKQMFVLPNVLKNLKDNGIIITLIKPHYEADRKLLKKGVLDESVAENVSKNVLSEIKSLGIKINGLIKSPVIGKGGNTEYLAYLQV
jgi:23S rRNA (cytidine1920-2'-O)/16S rRNA (cytidine1409-2'-O)-methyltransferase